METLAIADPERSRFSVWHVDIPNAGKLEVGYYMDGLYWWRLDERTGALLQNGHSLSVRGEQSTRSAAKALLLFLLATAESPLLDVNHATTWASSHGDELRRALARLSGPRRR